MPHASSFAELTGHVLSGQLARPDYLTRDLVEWSTRLHSVRGHVAHYGDCCPGRHEPGGLLSGRTTGRVWVPQHARGVAALGQTHQTYVIKETP